VFLLFGRDYLALGANPTSHFFGSSFVGNKTKICIFRALDWLSSITKAKIMTQKTNF